MTTRDVDPADGLPVSVVKNWAEEKYRHVENYAKMFARSMQHKWDRLTYLDLYAGGGRVKIEGSDRVVDSAALRVLAVDPGFDLFLYADLDSELLEALDKRVRARTSAVQSHCEQGDVNITWPTLLNRIRNPSFRGSYLTFCFVDPYRCADLAFATIEGLAAIYMDFLVLIPSFMDANRNKKSYLRASNSKLSTFLGDDDWRAAWPAFEDQKVKFGSFVADQFGVRMRRLGFGYDGLHDMRLIHSTDKNLPLYHLAFFSRDPVGQKLWREAIKYSHPQQSLF